MEFAWHALVLVFAGVLLLRIAGRKSISQMSLPQTVVMISVGSIIVKPIVESSVWETIIAVGIFVVSLIFMEYLQIKSTFAEKIFTGEAKIVIENGKIDEKTLHKLRFSADQLEMRLRANGISRIEHVKYATLEPNGQVGYELMDDQKPLTIGEFKKLMGMVKPESIGNSQNETAINLFEQLKKGNVEQNEKQ